MNTSKYILTLCLAITAFLAHAQDTVWVRKCAPTAHETYAVAFSEDGNKIITGSECSPSYIRLFNSTDGTAMWEYELGSSLMCVQGVKLSASGTKAAAMEEMGNLLIFDYTGSTPTLTNTINTGTSGAFALDFSPDGTRLVTACTDKQMKIYSVADGTELHNTTAHASWVLSVDWSPLANTIVTGGNDNLVKIWDTTGVLIKSLSGHTGAVQSVRYSSDGKYIVSGSKDDKIKIWEAASGTLVRTITGHTGDVMQVDISDDATTIVSGSADSTIRIWDLITGTQSISFKKVNSGTVYSVDFSPNGKLVVAGTSNGDVQLWNVQNTTDVRVTVLQENAFMLFPNPCKDNITLKITEGVLSHILVTDLYGNTIIEKSAKGAVGYIETSGFSPGYYYITVITEQGVTHKSKFLKR